MNKTTVIVVGVIITVVLLLTIITVFVGGIFGSGPDLEDNPYIATGETTTIVPPSSGSGLVSPGSQAGSGTSTFPSGGLTL